MNSRPPPGTVPLGVVTWILCSPAACAGESAVMLVGGGGAHDGAGHRAKEHRSHPEEVGPGDGDGGAPSGRARGGRNGGDGWRLSRGEAGCHDVGGT